MVVRAQRRLDRVGDPRSSPLTDSMSIKARSSSTRSPVQVEHGRSVMRSTRSSIQAHLVDRTRRQALRSPVSAGGHDRTRRARTAPPGAGGLATIARQRRQVLDTYFPAPVLGVPTRAPAGRARRRRSARTTLRGVRTELVRTVIDLDAPPADTADAYLRLHLLSHRLVQPRTINLDGIFGVAAQRGVDLRRPVRGRRLRERPDPAARPARHRSPSTASTSSRGWSTTCCPPASASPTPTGSGSAPTWPRAPP